jgi:hypothetical protein
MADTDHMTGLLANVAGGIQVLADGLLAEPCHGADGIPAACWKRCGTRLGHYHEPVVVEPRVDQVELHETSLFKHSEIISYIPALAN